MKIKLDFSAMSKKQIIEYVWDYYKWYFIVFVLFIGILINIVYTNVTSKEYILRGIFINSTGEEAGEEIEQSFREYSAIDTDQKDIFFDTSYYFSGDINSSYALESYETLQVMNAKIVVGEVDFMVGDLNTMHDMAYRQYFLELSDVLEEDILKEITPHLIYYDKVFIEELSNLDISENGKKAISYPDPRKPELMQEPIPVFIDVSFCEKLKDLYPYDTNEYVIALTINSSNIVKALEFIEFLME